jgi:hypothetical protein
MSEAVVARRVLLAIFLGLMAWGGYHAVGLFQSEEAVGRGVLKASLVIMTTTLFLLWWGWLLWLHRRRVQRGKRPEVGAMKNERG